jgi:hypothetical protein
MSEETSPTLEDDDATQLDPSQVQYLQQRLESEQNLPLAFVGGLGASILGAGVWAGITVVSGYQIGFMAIGIGFLVGFVVRSLGNGITSTFGVLGAVLSLIGCALGNLLAVTALVAREQGVAFVDALSQLNPGLIQELMITFFGPMDLLFYAIALYYGYKLAFRQLTDEDLQRMLSGGAAA